MFGLGLPELIVLAVFFPPVVGGVVLLVFLLESQKVGWPRDGGAECRDERRRPCVR
jgi:hypothetical protein